MENENLEQTEQVQHAEQPHAKMPEKQLTRAQAFFKDVRDFIFILAIFMIVYVLCFRQVVVVGDSMNHTLVDGDRLLLVSNLFYRNPEPGDIIVASKSSFRNGEAIVKRVIATEGQTIDIDFTTGNVYVDGELLNETYIATETMLPEGTQFPLTVEPGCVFVMGDNRMDSTDSRNPLIGQIDTREILGKVIFLMFPGADESHDREFDRIGVIN